MENKIENQEKGNSVNSDFFITKLYQGDEKINNQTFNLRFEGIVNYERGNVKVLDRYNDWDTENIFNFSRLILVKDLFLKVHSPINKESSWKGSCNCPTNPIVYKKNNYLDGVLPELSFIKGKFVTISNDYKKQNISTDFLFSVGEFEKEDRKYQDKGSYLYDFKYFSFTKEGEDLSESQSFTVPLLVINGRAFLFLNNAIISTLGFGFKFVDSIKCDDGDGDSEGFFEWRYMHDNNEDTDYAERVGWNTCNRTDDYCESNYKGRSNYETRCNRPTLIEVFKKSDYLLDEKKISINSKDYFLFELIEQD